MLKKVQTWLKIIPKDKKTINQARITKTRFAKILVKTNMEINEFKNFK